MCTNVFQKLYSLLAFHWFDVDNNDDDDDDDDDDDVDDDKSIMLNVGDKVSKLRR